MGQFLSKKERLKLLKAHKQESKQRYADRIKAIILLDSNWSAFKIAEALLLDENTIRNYKERYLSGGLEQLCNNAYQGRTCSLNKEELAKLEKELRANIPITVEFLVTKLDGYVAERSGKQYIVDSG